MKLIWPKGVRAKLWVKHRVRPKEVEEALQDPRRRVRRAEKAKRQGKKGFRRYQTVGRTHSGRLLSVYSEPTPEGLMIISAYDADEKAWRFYTRR